MSAETPQERSYIFDRESSAEIARLTNQDRLVTRAMGGPLSGLPDGYHLPEQASVLDIACGPGDWVLDVAYASPDFEVAGVDMSRSMVDYANARARSEGLANASFGVMDITYPLDFADASFDLVNARYLTGVLKREMWPVFLQEALRLLRPGGILRLTEPDDTGQSSSAAFQQGGRWFMQAMKQVGYGFSPDGSSFGMFPQLRWLSQEAGFQQIRQTAHVIDFSQDTSAWADFYQGVQVAFPQSLRHLRTVATQNEVEEVYRETLIQMNDPSFRAIWILLTMCGRKPCETTTVSTD